MAGDIDQFTRQPISARAALRRAVMERLSRLPERDPSIVNHVLRIPANRLKATVEAGMPTPPPAPSVVL
jgi:hypothetical protein